jgi:hypothetical protein
MVILQEEEEKKRRRRARRLYNGLEDYYEEPPELVGGETLLGIDELPSYGYGARPRGDFVLKWSQQDLDAKNTPPPPIYGPSDDTRDKYLKDMQFGDSVTVDKFVIYRHCMNLSASVAVGWSGRYLPHIRSWRPFDPSKPGERYYSIHQIAGPVVAFHIPYTGGRRKKKKSKKISDDLPPRWLPRPVEAMTGDVSLWGFVAKHKLKKKLYEAVDLRPRAKIIMPSPKQLQAQFRRFQVATAISDYPGRSQKELVAILQAEYIKCKEIGTKKSGKKVIVAGPDDQAAIPWDLRKVNPILSALIEAGKIHNRYAVTGTKIYYINDAIFTRNSALNIEGEGISPK